MQRSDMARVRELLAAGEQFDSGQLEDFACHGCAEWIEVAFDAGARPTFRTICRRFCAMLSGAAFYDSLGQPEPEWALATCRAITAGVDRNLSVEVAERHPPSRSWRTCANRRTPSTAAPTTES